LGKIKDPRAVNVLLAALRERDLAVVAGAYSFFIERGEPGSEDVLIQALNAHGSGATAVAFLNCGNSALSKAAGEWAEAHGYEVQQWYGTAGHARWGSGR
jgi:hypothetical protein